MTELELIHLETVMRAPKSVDQVWDLFTDINTMAECVPTCREYQILDPDTVFAQLRIKLGLIPLDSKATVRIVERKPPHRLVAEGRTEAGESLKKYGKIGADSQTRIRMTLDFEPVGESETRIDARIEADASGQLKRVYEAIIKGQREKMEAEFVDNVSRVLGAPVVVEQRSEAMD
jgi:carbon monoxide dehydrogenase subunit G